METSLILGLVGGLVVAGFAAFVALRSNEDELEYEEGVDGPIVKARKAKSGFLSKLGFGPKKSTDSLAGKRSEKAAGWRKDIAEACEATGLIKAEAVSWIAPASAAMSSSSAWLGSRSACPKSWRRCVPEYRIVSKRSGPNSERSSPCSNTSYAAAAAIAGQKPMSMRPKASPTPRCTAVHGSIAASFCSDLRVARTFMSPR